MHATPARPGAIALSFVFDLCRLRLKRAPSPTLPRLHLRPVAAPVTDDVLRAGLEEPYVLRSGDGTAAQRPHHPADGPRARPPVALALVIDTSGSMEGEKLEHAGSRPGASPRPLGPDDEVAVVAFASEVRVVSPRAPVAAPSSPSSTASRPPPAPPLHGGSSPA
ncbi:MAG: hypothetical protein R3F43_21245 [bacterium]